MKFIVITYKNGSYINLEVPEFYYQEKYPDKSNKEINTIFMKEYSKFVKALNSSHGFVLQVNKYFKFSNATISSEDVLMVDIKEFDSENKPLDNVIFIPGVHDKVYLDLKDTRLDNFLDKLEGLETLENLDQIFKKLIYYFNKSNVEFTIKTSKKASPSRNK